MLLFSVLNNSFGDNCVSRIAGIKLGPIFSTQVQVFESLIWVGFIIPSNFEQGYQFFSDTDSGTGVGTQVDTRNTALTGQFSTFVEKDILLGTKRTNLVSDVVCNNDEVSSTRVLWCLGSNLETNHTDLICTGVSVDCGQIAIFVFNQLQGGENILGNLGVLELLPASHGSLTEQFWEIIDCIEPGWPIDLKTHSSLLFLTSMYNSDFTTYPETLLIIALNGKEFPVVGSVQAIRISAPVTRNLHNLLPNLSKKEPKAASTSSGKTLKTAAKLMKIWLRSELEVSMISMASKMSDINALDSEIKYSAIEISSRITPVRIIPRVKNLLSEGAFLPTAS